MAVCIVDRPSIGDSDRGDITVLGAGPDIGLAPCGATGGLRSHVPRTGEQIVFIGGRRFFRDIAGLIQDPFQHGRIIGIVLHVPIRVSIRVAGDPGALPDVLAPGDRTQDIESLHLFKEGLPPGWKVVRIEKTDVEQVLVQQADTGRHGHDPVDLQCDQIMDLIDLLVSKRFHRLL